MRYAMLVILSLAWLGSAGRYTLASSTATLPYDGTLYSTYGFIKMVREGNFPWVKQFVENGIDVNVHVEEGRTPLMWAVIEDHLHLVKYLLSAGAQVNALDAFGNTPLTWAAHYGHVDIAQILLQAGAHIDWKEYRFGWTPLMVATFYGQESMVQSLLRASADIQAIDKHHWNALSIAQATGWPRIAHLLKQEGTTEWLCQPMLITGDFRTVCGTYKEP